MAYSNATISNADLFNGGTSLNSLLTAAGWTCSSSATSFTASKGLIYAQFVRTAVDVPTFKVYLSDNGGTSYSDYQTLRFAPDGTYTGNLDVHFFADTSPETIKIVIGGVSGGLYYYNIIYLGYIARFDSTDVNAYGLYVSGAPEARGVNYPHEGISLSTLETMLLRSVQPITAVTGNMPFKFMDMDTVVEMVNSDYNSRGTKNNLLTGSVDFDGNSMRDLWEESKYLGRRMGQVGVYKEYIGNNGRGLRGTLRGLYAVQQFWTLDNAGNKIPHKIGKQALAATVLTSTRGEKRFDGETDWLVFPLYNSVKDYYIYNGLHVIALPKV
jgi:hypothetical protein